MNPKFWKNKKVLVTGHNGFKGCWLTKWLDLLEVNLVGLSLCPEPTSDITKLSFNGHYVNIEEDISNYENIKQYQQCEPEIVIHLAGKSSLKIANNSPRDAFATNVMGTANLLELLTRMPSVQSIVIVTSDKVYKDRGTAIPYTEEDPLAGEEPYSCSKVAQEQVARAYYENWFKKQHIGMATARASNAFGAGDYHFDRLIPYLEKCLYENTIPEIRNPKSIRPWQYVLNVLDGYMTLAEYLFYHANNSWQNYNFGPDFEELYTVSEIADMICGRVKNTDIQNTYKESDYLFISSEKSNTRLKWFPRYSVRQGIEQTNEAYRCYFENGNINKLYETAILNYMKRRK